MSHFQILVFIFLHSDFSCKSRKPTPSSNYPNQIADASGDISPAEKFCLEQGGTLKNFRAAEGPEVQTCVFGAARIELTSLLTAKQNKAVARFFASSAVEGADHAPPVANPASINCAENSGQSNATFDEAGEFSFCKFDDGSMIEEWTLYRGSGSSENTKLKAALEAARSS